MNFIENLKTSSIYSVNDIRTSQFSLNSLGTYVYNVLNSSTIHTIQSQFSEYANLNTSNYFIYPPETTIPFLPTQLTNKSYVDDIISCNISNFKIGLFTDISLNNIFSNSLSMNLTNPRQIGYTYYSGWLTVLEPIVFDTPGVWNIYTQFEYTGGGSISHLNAGYTNIIYSENNIQTPIQRFVPSIVINKSGILTVTIVSQFNAIGNINFRYQYFYVRIA
jgi:hypothetical protein